MKKMIIRADDLGYSEGVNYGIAKACIDELVSSVGVMVNLEPVQHGLDLLAGHDVCLGMHTNISVGKPVSDAVLIPSLVQANGAFKTSDIYRSATEDFVVLEEVMLEIEAQYNKFIELVGYPPKYVDIHAVGSKNFFIGLKIVTDKLGAGYLDIKFDGSPMTYKGTNVYMTMEFMDPNYNPFETLKKAALHERSAEGVEMLVFHPGYLDAYILENSSLTTPRPMEVQMLCASETKAWLKEHAIEIIAFDDLA